MSRRVVYFILNGIHTNPAQTDGWVDEAATLLCPIMRTVHPSSA